MPIKSAKNPIKNRAMETNYSHHARYWDWDGYDDSLAYEFWYQMSRRYGNKILSAMCAIGQSGAYMAQKGCRVTALDYTPEMITEGRKRFGAVKGLTFVQADITAFDLPEKNYDFCYVASADLHVLPSLEQVEKALLCIAKQLRVGGGLGLEVWYPPALSSTVPLRRFEPRAPRKDGLYIWKESRSEYDAERQTQSIFQTVYVEKADKTISFPHELVLQLYDKGTLFALFSKCGYEVVGQYGDYGFQTHDDEQKNCFIELKRLN